VKRKDAPNYYDIIKNPIDLTQIKNKAKRIEYFTKDQLLADFQLLVDNAMIFNGQTSAIARNAGDIY
jgi:Bromodomain